MSTDIIETNGIKSRRAPAVKQANAISIVIPQIISARINLTVEGITPLIAHKFSDKARKMMAEKQQGKAVAKKAPKDPEADFNAARHRIDKKTDGFPAVAFKAAALQATSFCEGVNKVEASGAFHIDCDLVPLEYEELVMREDPVRNATGVADLRYRPEYKGWKATLPISYNANVITPEQIVHLFNLAGFSVGIGEMRPLSKERRTSGVFGRFKVVSTKEAKS